MKILSIIIPIYNTKIHLKKCINSVLKARSNYDIEILLINDESTDGSEKIINYYAKKYPETIKSFNKKNGGHGSVINFGIKKSKGIYCKVLDSDDFLNSTNLKELIIFLKKTINSSDISIDLIINSYSKCFQNKKIIQSLKLEKNKILSFSTLENILIYFKSKKYINYIPMAMATYNTKLLKNSKKKILEKTYYVDTEFNVYFINEVNNFVYLDYPIYNYNIGNVNQSISSKNFVSNYNDHFKVIDKLIFYYNTYCFKSILHKKLTEIILLRLLNTHYLIFGYHLKKIQKKHVLKNIFFDRWLKEKNSYLYEKIGIRRYIFIGRIFNFNKLIYSSLIIKLSILYEIIFGTWKKYDI